MNAEPCRRTALHSHILLLYREMIPSVRLCGHAQMWTLERRGEAEYRAMQELRVTLSDLNWADIVLLARFDSGYEFRLTQWLHEARKTLVYILDDDLLDVPPHVRSAAYYARQAGNIRGMIEMSDAILSPSPRLLEKYAKGKRAISIEEPAIDPAPYSPHDPNAPVRIGFAGSIDRTQEIESLLGNALRRIAGEYGERVVFEFFGAAPSFAKDLGARCVPYRDSYGAYRRTLNELAWDIGLAPMPDTPFHACKHYNKFIEYAAAGVTGVYSRVEPYTRLARWLGEESFSGNTEDEWYGKIRALIDDAKLREALRERCCALAQSVFSLEGTSRALLRQLEEIGPARDQAPIRRPLPLYKAQYLCLRAADLVARYGTKLPGRIVDKVRAGLDDRG